MLGTAAGICALAISELPTGPWREGTPLQTLTADMNQDLKAGLMGMTLRCNETVLMCFVFVVFYFCFVLLLMLPIRFFSFPNSEAPL